MNKNLTEMIFIMDRSGSMQNLVSDTIGGYNSMIDKQKKTKKVKLPLQQYCLMMSMTFYLRMSI